jgi:hypothetical protein
MENLYCFVLQHLEIIKVVFIVIAGSLTIIQYWSSNKFKRSQYLCELWRKFYQTKVLTDIFQALDRKDKKEFEKITESDIYLYLAYLEEIVIFSKNNSFEIHKINRNELLDLFQFHFYWVYECEETKKLFWGKILGTEDSTSIKNEINSYYWANQRKFSSIRKNKIDEELKKIK